MKIYLPWSRLFVVVALGALILGMGGFDRSHIFGLFGLGETSRIKFPAIASIPVSKQVLVGKDVSQVVPTASITAQAVYLYDPQSQTAIYQKNADQLFYIASLTKMMTALVVSEKLALDEVITIQNSDLVYSNKLGLTAGERLTVDALMHAMLISSSNEATEALARSYPGGYYALVSAMNSRATQMGLVDTKFTNPIGYDHSQHQSTAKEVAMLSEAFISNQYLADIVKNPTFIITDQDQLHEHQLYSTNQLLSLDVRYQGIKTGTTIAAGEAFSAWFVFKDSAGFDHQIIAVVLSSTNRFGDVTKLINWVLDEYTWYRPEQLM